MFDFVIPDFLGERPSQFPIFRRGGTIFESPLRLSISIEMVMFGVFGLRKPQITRRKPYMQLVGNFGGILVSTCRADHFRVVVV